MRNLTDTQIGFAVKSAREAAGRSAVELAMQCGLTGPKLSKIEGGKQTLSFSKAADICAALGIDTQQLAHLAEAMAGVADQRAAIREQLKKEMKELEKRTLLTAKTMASNGRKPIARAAA